jgi:hypothetical protein
MAEAAAQAAATGTEASEPTAEPVAREQRIPTGAAALEHREPEASPPNADAALQATSKVEHREPGAPPPNVDAALQAATSKGPKWTTGYSEKFKEHYWYNNETEESHWVHPDTGLMPDGTRPEDGDDSDDGSTTAPAKRARVEDDEGASAPGGGTQGDTMCAQGSEEESDYEVDHIVDRRGTRSKLEYRVRWKGYGAEDDTWEPLNNLDNARAKVKTFEKRLKKTQARSQATAHGRGGRGGRGRGRQAHAGHAKASVPVVAVVVVDSEASSAALVPRPAAAAPPAEREHELKLVTVTEDGTLGVQFDRQLRLTMVNEAGLGFKSGMRLGMALHLFQGEPHQGFDATMKRMVTTPRPWSLVMCAGDSAPDTSTCREFEASAARKALIQASRNVTEAWRKAASPCPEDDPCTADPPAVELLPHGAPRALDGEMTSPSSTGAISPSAEAGAAEDRVTPAVKKREREPSNDAIGLRGIRIKAKFAELAYHTGPVREGKANSKHVIRAAVTDAGDTHVSIADFLEFIGVHNRLNAQSMASTLMGDPKKRQKYALMYGSVDGSKRRTPMIRVADHFPNYVRSLGKLRALGKELPERDAAQLWEAYDSCDEKKGWLKLELNESDKVSGTLFESTDELPRKWVRHAKHAGSPSSGSAASRGQTSRKRSARISQTSNTAWVYRELSKVLVTLPQHLKPSDSFSLKVPGVDTLVTVEYPEGGVPGKQIELTLVKSITQKVRASEVLPGDKVFPCYCDDDESDEVPQTNVRRVTRPADRVPSQIEIASMRAEMQTQPGLQHSDISAGKEHVPIPVVNTVDDEVFDLSTFRYVATPEIPEKIQALIDAAPPVPCKCVGSCGGVGAALCGCVDRFGDVYDLIVKTELKTLPADQRPVGISTANDTKVSATPAPGLRRGLPGVSRRVRARKVEDSVWTSYPSINQASKGTGVEYNEVHKCCRTSLIDTGGYVFEYEGTSNRNDSPATSPAEPIISSGGGGGGSSSKTPRTYTCANCGHQKMSPNGKCTSCNPTVAAERSTQQSPKSTAAAGSAAAAPPTTFNCGAQLAEAVAGALGGLDVSSIHSDEDNHATGGGLDGVASLQYKTQRDNETMQGVAASFGTGVSDVLDASKHWYPDLSANSKMFPGTYVRLPAEVGRLAIGCRAIMNIAGTSLGPEEAEARLGALQAAGAGWEISEVKATRYGAYHKGRLGPAISFSVIHECTDACGCQPLRKDLALGCNGCGNRHLQRGIRPDVLLEVFRVGVDKGWGLRSRTFIPAGTFVCEYVGEMLTDKEANERGRVKGPEYLFDLDVAVQRRHDERRQQLQKSGVEAASTTGTTAGVAAAGSAAASGAAAAATEAADDAERIQEDETTQEFVRAPADLLSTCCLLYCMYKEALLYSVQISRVALHTLRPATDGVVVVLYPVWCPPLRTQRMHVLPRCVSR